jgi:hypothetical protein
MTLLKTALVLAFAVTFAAAWTAPIVLVPTLTSSRSSLMAASSEQNAEETTTSSLDRRNFFQSATTKVATASLSLLVASSVTSPGVAYAVDVDSTTSTPYSKIYKPAPHSMDGKLVIITGGNAGLGLESSKRLAEAGATVVFTSRDEAKGQKALAEINDYLKQQITDDGTFAGKVFMASLDLCDLDNVKSFKDRLINVIGKDQKIDVLLNNAGVSEYT